jgi:predicted amidophosphoribosyltransferase
MVHAIKNQEDKMNTTKSVKMTSKFKGTCRVCKKKINPGDTIWWNKTTKQVSHAGCFEGKVYLGKTYAWKQTPFAGSYKNGRRKRL